MLLELVHQLEGARDFSKVPNLIYRQKDKTVVNQPFYSENINALAAPNFDGMPLGQYFAPQAVLPVPPIPRIPRQERVGPTEVPRTRRPNDVACAMS